MFISAFGTLSGMMIFQFQYIFPEIKYDAVNKGQMEYYVRWNCGV